MLFSEWEREVCFLKKEALCQMLFPEWEREVCFLKKEVLCQMLFPERDRREGGLFSEEIREMRDFFKTQTITYF